MRVHAPTVGRIVVAGAGMVAGLLALAVASPAPAAAQPTFDAQSSKAATFTSAAPSTALPHTIGAGANGILLVSVSMNIGSSPGAAVGSVTWAGTSLTLLGAVADATPDTRTELWYRLAPASGASQVAVTVGGIAPGASVKAVVGATSFSAVDQVAPATAASHGVGDPATVTVLGTTSTCVVLDFISAREAVTLTPDPPLVAGYNQSSGGTVSDVQAASSGRLGAAPSTTMSWNVSANRRWSIVAVALAQATAEVEVSGRALPDPVAPGGGLTYTFDVTNRGPSAAQGVTLSAPLPAAIAFSSSRATQGSCSGTATVTCSLGALAAGVTATVMIEGSAPAAGGLIAATTATVTTTSSDPATPNTASATSWVLVESAVCPTQPAKDGAGGTLAGVVNAYWPGTSSAAAGATSITLGARRGAAVSIALGDLLLVMQMQDATVDSSNDERYGDGKGVAGGTERPGAGATDTGNAGRYEYAVATSTVGAAGGTLTIAGAGSGGGVLFAYASASATATRGQRRFQVIRVPQYASATLGSTLTAASWNGTTGGVLALDVAGDLALGSATVSVSGLGFRGAAGLQLAGGAGSRDDYRSTFAALAHGGKGEGIAGTPEWVLDSGVNLDTGPQGYPSGDRARGAPGNGGGGGTDGDPAANDENSGGGGGAGRGAGGQGGRTWTSNLDRGGFGGAPFFASAGRVALGGGGGGGARNNPATVASAGGAGGGIVLVRAGRLTGAGTIAANGAAAFNDTANDGGGGGGGGGAVVVQALGGGIDGLTASARGGRGGDAWRSQAPGGWPGERHGPGGGGGGGFVALTGTPASVDVAGGASGITTTANEAFGATAGAAGLAVVSPLADQVARTPGVEAGCAALAVTASGSPDPVVGGTRITYTETVTNGSPAVPAQAVTLTQTTPAFTTFESLTPPAGWACTAPAVGGTGAVTCSRTSPLAPGASSGPLTLVVRTSVALAEGATIAHQATVGSPHPEPYQSDNTAAVTTGVVDRRPRVSSIALAAASPTSATSVAFIVTFFPAVSGVDSSDFALTAGGGLAGAALTGFEAVSATQYRVTVSTGSGDGTLRLDVLDDDSIQAVYDGTALPLGGPGAGNGAYGSGPSYTVVDPPEVLAVTRAGPSPTAAASVDFTVRFSEEVFGVDAGDLAIASTGTLAGMSVSAVSGSGDTRTVTVATGSGNGTLRLDVLDDDTIIDGSSHPLAGPFSGGEAYALVRPADVAITGAADDPTPAVGAAVTLTFTAVDRGPNAASGVLVQALLPPGLTYVSHALGGGVSYSPASGEWEVGELATGGAATLALTATVSSPGALAAVATVVGQAETDPEAGNGTAVVLLHAPAAADLQVAATLDTATLALGEEATLVVTARNAGPDGASGVLLSVALPAGLEPGSAATSQGGYGAGVWDLGALAARGSATLALTVTGTAAGPRTIVAAKLAQDQPDPLAGNDTASATLDDPTAADLALGLVASQDPVADGETFAITLVVANAGPGAASGVALTDDLPAGLSLVSTSPSQGSCGGDPSVVCTLGAIPAGACAAVRLLVRKVGPGPATTSAVVTAAESDPYLANNSASGGTTPVLLQRLTIE